MGLQEIRVNDIATTFTRPKNYIPFIVGGAVFAREKFDTPMGEVRNVALSELDAELEKVQRATLKLYRKVSTMSRRELIWAGHDVYYFGMILPHLRKAGTWDR